MGHDYGVPLTFLSITPTRDNVAAPGNRLADKHARLFHGKTLDEWTMLQLWSSKYLGKAFFVCETEEHYGKLLPVAQKYGVELLVRPREMLHPVNDTGTLPIMYGFREAMARDYYSLVMTPFVVSPCRPPGFFDYMVEQYLRLMPGPDYEKGQAWIMGASEADGVFYEKDGEDRGRQLGAIYLNKNPEFRFTSTQHWLGATWWYEARVVVANSRHDLSFAPKLFDIEPWQDIHIDTLDQWEWAEYWFAKKILSQGEDCYHRYRESWEGKSA
jgi:hypothetical protein